MTTVPEAKPESGAARAGQVRRIFSEIAPRYDLLNHLLSLNVDRRWRRRAADRVGPGLRDGGLFLDACSGTHDLALELARRPGFSGTVIASDFAMAMLVEGRKKLDGARIVPVCADALRLPFPDGTFHGAMVGFGVRNLADVSGGLRELARVLRSGGRLVILEFSVPPNPLLRALYMLYFTRILPALGRLVSGHPSAYSYLPASVREFPGPADLAQLMDRSGFRETRWEALSGGIAALHVAERR